MTYNFKEISDLKFSLNGRESFKTFIPFFVDDKHILVLNIYDSNLRLVPVENVLNFTVNDVVYQNSTELINALHSVVFSPVVSGGDADLTSIINDISNLKSNKSNVGHTHDDRYYTETEIDQKLLNIGGSDIVSGLVDNDKIKFYDSKNQQLFQIDARRLAEQGTVMSFENGRLLLKNNYGETLSSLIIQVEGNYYDRFTFVSNISDDLEFIQTSNYELVKTVSDKYYFFSTEDLNNSKIYLNDLDKFFYLSNENKLDNANAWSLNIEDDNYIEGVPYNFNIWRNFEEVNFLIFETKDDAISYKSENNPKDGVLGFMQDEKLFYYINDSEWQLLISDYLKTPTINGNTTTHPFVVGINSENETAKLPAGDLGKNFANTDLVVSQNRNHTGTGTVSMGMPFVFSNPNIRYTALQDKSTDATFNRTQVFDSNGSANYITNPYNLHKSQWSLLTPVQKRELIQVLSDNAADTGLMNVNMINPYVIQNRFNSTEYVIIRGSNLRFGNEGRIEIINRDTGVVVETIPRNKITSESSTELKFEHNFYNFPVGVYVLNIDKGIDRYKTSQEFRVVEQVENIDINAITWEWVYADGITPSIEDVANGGTFTIKTPAVASAIPLVNLKSAELFAEGTDFSIEINLSIGTGLGVATANTSQIGIGYSNSNLNTNFQSLCYYRYTNNRSIPSQLFFVSYNNNITINPTLQAPTMVTMLFTKTGNLFKTTIGSSVDIKTLSNNSGYSLFAQIIGNKDSSQIIQGQIVKAFKFN